MTYQQIFKKLLINEDKIRENAFQTIIVIIEKNNKIKMEQIISQNSNSKIINATPNILKEIYEELNRRKKIFYEKSVNKIVFKIHEGHLVHINISRYL